MTVDNYKWSVVLYVFLRELDDYERSRPWVVKIFNAINRKNHVPKVIEDKTYLKAVDIATEAFKKSWTEFSDGKTISVSSIAWLINNRYREALKPYKFNDKHFNQLNRNGSSGFAMNSAKVLNAIEKYMDQ